MLTAAAPQQQYFFFSSSAAIQNATATPPLDGNAASGRQRRLWTVTPPLDGNAASGRQRRLWTVTPPLDDNAASGQQRRLWTATPPLDGNAASGRRRLGKLYVTCLCKLYLRSTPYVLKTIASSIKVLNSLDLPKSIITYSIVTVTVGR
jgi:hypothetical protein